MELLISIVCKIIGLRYPTVAVGNEIGRELGTEVREGRMRHSTAAFLLIVSALCGLVVIKPDTRSDIAALPQQPKSLPAEDPPEGPNDDADVDTQDSRSEILAQSAILAKLTDPAFKKQLTKQVTAQVMALLKTQANDKAAASIVDCAAPRRCRCQRRWCRLKS